MTESQTICNRQRNRKLAQMIISDLEQKGFDFRFWFDPLQIDTLVMKDPSQPYGEWERLPSKKSQQSYWGKYIPELRHILLDAKLLNALAIELHLHAGNKPHIQPTQEQQKLPSSRR